MNSQRLKELRKKTGLNQSQFAELFGFSNQRYNYYETGKREPDNQTTAIFAEYFNVSTDYLLGLSDTLEPIDEKKEHQTAPSDVAEFYDLLIRIGVRDPDKPLSPKAKQRLFNLIKNNANLIVEDEDKEE